jgi:hypothetical protein
MHPEVAVLNRIIFVVRGLPKELAVIPQILPKPADMLRMEVSAPLPRLLSQVPEFPRVAGLLEPPPRIMPFFQRKERLDKQRFQHCTQAL